MKDRDLDRWLGFTDEDGGDTWRGLVAGLVAFLLLCGGIVAWLIAYGG